MKMNCKETLFFSEHNGRLCQWLEIELGLGLQQSMIGEITITSHGISVVTRLELQPGDATYRVYAPALYPQPADPEADITFRVGEDVYPGKIAIGNYRPWTVYLLSDTCTDYTWVYATVDEMIEHDSALTLAELNAWENYRNEDRASQNRYNLVHSREIEYFLQRYPEQEERLVRAFQEGVFTLNPVYNMSVFGDMTVEEILRSFYYAKRFARKHQISMRHANIQETPTTPWSIVPLLKGSGIETVLRHILPYETPWCRRLEDLRLYDWEGPDGSRIRVRLRNRDYVEGHFVMKGLEETKKALHESIIPSYEGMKDGYPFDCIALAGSYGDLAYETRSMPEKKSQTIREYNQQGWQFPRLVNATHQQFWEHVERNQRTNNIELPVRKGDYGISWEAWPSCMAEDFAGYRAAQSKSAIADRLAAILSAMIPEWYTQNDKLLEDAWTNLLSLADHAWNGANNQNRLLNASLRRQWQQSANCSFQTLIESGMSALAGFIGNSMHNQYLVFNENNWERSGLAIVENVVGDIPGGTQKEEGGFIAHVHKVPSVGYRVINQPSFSQKAIAVKKDSIENDFYRVRISLVDGGIISLFDKVRNVELVDSASPYRLNQPLYWSEKPPRAVQQPTFQLFTGAPLPDMCEQTAVLMNSRPGNNGPVFGELITESKIGEITIHSIIRLYHQIDRIDFINTVYKPVTNHRQEFDFAFPFHVPERVIHYEAPGALINPEADHLVGAGKSYLAIRNFVDFSNDSYGVTLAVVDGGIVEFGHRTTNEDVEEFDRNATVLCVALQNVIDVNESIQDQFGSTKFTFRYCLQGHSGKMNPIDAIRFGIESQRPMTMVKMGDGGNSDTLQSELSFLSVEPKDIMLVGFRKADEEGYIARFWQPGDKDCDIRIRWNAAKRLQKAVITDLLETDLQEVPVDKNEVIVPIKKKGFVAVRLIC